VCCSVLQSVHVHEQDAQERDAHLREVVEESL